MVDNSEGRSGLTRALVVVWFVCVVLGVWCGGGGGGGVGGGGGGGGGWGVGGGGEGWGEVGRALGLYDCPICTQTKFAVFIR